MAYVKTNWVDNTTPINETNLNKIESGIKNNDINIGEENYDNTKTYEVGDIVRYNEKIYKCITAITTAENFDSSKWEQTNIVEIVQSEKSKIYELIEALSTPIVGEGESIDLNDSAEMRFSEFYVRGNSKQETRAGYNLLNFDVKQNSRVTYNNEDGTITINGQGGFTLACKQFTAKANTKYYIKWELVSGTVDTSQSNGNSFLSSLDNKNIKQGEFKESVVESDKDINGFWVNNMTVFTNAVIKFWANTNKSDFEQYGASPSPDYPSEVECCGDNINIFDGEVEEGNIDASTGQNAVVTNAWRSKNYLNVKDTSVSISVKDLTFSGTVGRLYFYKSDNTYISNILINSLPFTATLPNETAKVRFFILNSVADINAKIKLEKGSTVTPYSPYGQGCINEVICNKNLFNLNDYLLNMSLYSDGSIKFGQDNNLYYIPVQYGKKYIMSLNTTLATNCVYGYTNEFPSTSVKSTYNILNISNLNNHIFEPTNPDNKYLCIRINYVSQLPQMANIQLEEGQTATEYVKHQSQSYTIPTQQPMRAIGDTRDKFILKENGKWYERHNIKEVIFTGDENWTQRNQGDGTNTITFNVNLLNVGAYGSNNVLCDKFVYEQNSSSGNEGIGFESTLVTQYIQINRNRLSSLNLAGFKAWLSNNNTKLYYVLATPTDIECTLEQTEILNHMYIKAKSYKGVTHIYSNDAVSPNCYVEAVKDLTTLIQ